MLVPSFEFVVAGGSVYQSFDLFGISTDCCRETGGGEREGERREPGQEKGKPDQFCRESRPRFGLPSPSPVRVLSPNKEGGGEGG